MRRFIASAMGAALSLSFGGSANAFCRSTTCAADCPLDLEGCKTTGAPLFWASRCVGVSLQKDGTANLAMDDVRPVIEQGFLAWTDLPCDAGAASIAFSSLPDVACHKAEFNKDSENANIILFQDNKWDYQGEANNLAKTTVTYDTETGEIFDADMEINFAFNELTVGDDNVVFDLGSLVTHEIGHMIGLDHSAVPEATMYADYVEGSTTQRTLEVDDVDGACSAYPSDRKATCSPTPKNGLGDQCAGVGDEGMAGPSGCECAARSFDASGNGLSNAGGGPMMFALALFGIAQRRRCAPRCGSARSRRKPNGGVAKQSQ